MFAPEHHEQSEAVVHVHGAGRARRRSTRRRGRVAAIAVAAAALSGIGVGAAYGAVATVGKGNTAGLSVAEVHRPVVTAPVVAHVTKAVAPASQLDARVTGLVAEAQRIVTDKENQRLAAEKAARDAAARAAAKQEKEKFHGEYAEGDGGGCGWKHDAP